MDTHDPTALLDRAVADTGPGENTDPRRTALQALAGLLRGRGFVVAVESWHLTATDRDSGRSVEVWAQHRHVDGRRLWFCWAGGTPIVEAVNLTDAALYVGTALRSTP